MEDRLPDADLFFLSQWLADTAGLHFPAHRWNDLDRCMRNAARELGFPDCRSCLRAMVLTDDPSDQLATLIRHFTVGETYFFREKATFDALGKVVLPEIIESRRPRTRRLRIWNAACSTGEEPYSVAILLDQLLDDYDEWQISLLATDINPQALKRAQKGRYRNWSFRGVLETRHRGYFESLDDGRYEVSQKIRKRVDFAPLNLASDSYPSLMNGTNAIDLVMCRNVLMYFTPHQARRMIDRFYRCLVPGGWLLVGAVEVTAELFSSFLPVKLDGITAFRKPDPSKPEAFTRKTRPEAVFIHAPPDADTIPGEAPVAVSAPQPERECERVDAEPAIDLPTAEKDIQRFYETGDYDKVVAASLKLLECGDQPELMDLLARALANLGRLNEARKWAQNAVQRDSLDPRHHYLLAAILQETGELDEAVSSLTRAIYLAPKFVLAHFSLGGVLRRQGRAAESARHYMAALRLTNQLDPESRLPESDGLTAGRLRDIIRLLLKG